jgi:PRC-barrel domain
MATRRDVASWRGRTMVGAGGQKLGRIEEIYLDRATREPTWASVKGGLFGSRRAIVPLEDARERGDQIEVPFDRATVRAAPRPAETGELTPDEERALDRHYFGAPAQG